MSSPAVRALVGFTVLFACCAELSAAPRAETIKQAKAATVLVDLGVAGSGSGFCVDAKGLFITNFHVIASAGLGGHVDIVIDAAGKNERVLKARVILTDKENDLALLKAEAKKPFSTIALGDDSQLVETSSVIGFGYPFGRLLSADENGYPSISVNTGRVSALRKLKGELKLIQIDAALNPGNSGGPILDDDGKVIGVTVAGFGGARVNFAIPSSTVKSFIRKPAVILETDKLKYATLAEKTSLQVTLLPTQTDLSVDAVELSFRYQGFETNPVEVKAKAGTIGIEAIPLPKAVKPPQLQVKFSTEEKTTTVNCEDAEIQIGKRIFRLSELRRIERRKDTMIATRVDGEKLAGPLAKLPKLSSQEPLPPLSAIRRIDVHAETAMEPAITYVLRAIRKGESRNEVEGVLPIVGVPFSAQEVHTHRDPFREEVDKLIIEAQVDGRSDLHITGHGLYWEHRSGEKPGQPDGRGKFVTVNGRRWYPEWEFSSFESTDADDSVVVPIKIGGAVWNYKLESVSDVKTGKAAPKRGSVKQVPKREELVLEINDSASGAGTYRISLTKKQH